MLYYFVRNNFLGHCKRPIPAEDARKLKEQYENILSSINQKYEASKLKAYRDSMNKYAAKNDFASAAELQKVVEYLENRLSAKELVGRDELSRMERVSSKIGVQ